VWKYRVSFSFKGNRFAETFEASSSEAARRLIQCRFPGCSIWSVTKV
jgi:hypothetical protein